MRIEGKKLVRVGDKSPSEQLVELIKEEGKKVKLEVPFSADGFKSTKQPFQPDGITPIVVKETGLDKQVKVEKVKEEKVIKKKVTKKKK